MTALEVQVSTIVTLEVTPGQRRVIEALLIDGADNETIGRRLGISGGTVKTHMRVVLNRAGMPNRCALAIELLTGRMRLRTVDRNAPL